MRRFTFYQWSWFFAFVSFILRLPGFFVDLPHYNFIDEGIYTYGISAIALSSWGFAPTNYLAGGINYYLPSFVIIFLRFFHIHFDIDRVTILSRIIGPGILSCLAIPLLFATAKHLFRNEKIALISAGILAFSPLMLSISRIWYPDHYAVIFSVLALYAATRIITDPKPLTKNYLLLGLAIGLSTSTKYNGLFFGAMIPISHLIVSWRKPNWSSCLRDLFFAPGPWLALFTLVLTFILTNPYIFTHWPKYLAAIEATRAAYLAGSPGLLVANTPVYYYKLLFFTTFGILGSIFIISGIIITIRYHFQAAVLIIISALVFLCMMSVYRNAFDRNISVIVPFMALLFAVGLHTFWRHLNPRIMMIVLIIIVIEPTARILLNTVHDFLPDSRVIAANWINQNIPAHGKIGLGRGVYNGTLGLDIDYKKFTVSKLTYPPDPKVCVNYYFMDQWMHHLYGKSQSIFTSFFYSENIFRNTGGFYFKKEHEDIHRWLAQFKEIHRIKGYYYGPEIRIYQRKIPC